MKKLVITLLLVSAPSLAQAYECSGKYSCGSEYWDKPHRSPHPVAQPRVSQKVMGSCGEFLPLNQSYEARLTGVSCGSGDSTKVRQPLPVKEEIMEQWDLISRSGRPDAQDEMQQIRQQEEKWSGQISIPMAESWTYTQIVGDYADRCGYENFQTTCHKDRTEEYTEYYEVDVCTQYKEVDDSPSPSYNGGGSSYDSGGGSYSSPYSGGSPSDSGSGYGEDRQDFKNDAEDSWGSSLEEEYKPVNPSDRFLNLSRQPASRVCVSWGKERRSRTSRRAASRLTYSCVKQRPKWCTWPVTSQGSRACKTHVAKYSVNYEKDPNWKPGYVDQKDPARRSYIEILPNRWDLLIGEKEVVGLQIGGANSIAPQMTFKNGLAGHNEPWNEYSFQSQPQSARCQYDMAPQFKIGVITHGRILQAAPNPLRIPGEPLKFELSKNNRPQALELNDGGRGTRLKAAQNARNFGRNQGTDELYKNKDQEAKGASGSGGYWEETRFKIQLFRKDDWGREVRITVKPESYSYDQVDVFDDAITISLEGRDGTDRFYRPGGPLEFIFGRIYRAFNVELTPGQQYYIRVRVVSRGLPFYESGCTGGKAICKGEEGSAEAYSEAIDIPFTADPSVDKRSWLKKFRDWQERRKSL